MLSIEDLRYFNTGFEMSDPFGKGRLKQLIFDTREKLCFDKGEIEKWQQIAADEARLINKLHARLEDQSNEAALRAQVEDLQMQLANALATQKGLMDHISSLEQQLNEVHFSDEQAYRILKEMQNPYHINYREEVC